MFFGKDKEIDNWGFSASSKTFNNSKEISDEDYHEIIDRARKAGKCIIGDENGNPILADYPKPTPEEEHKSRIMELERFLSSTDWYATRYVDEGTPIPDDIKKQRHKAREEISDLRKSMEK